VIRIFLSASLPIVVTPEVKHVRVGCSFREI